MPVGVPRHATCEDLLKVPSRSPSWWKGSCSPARGHGHFTVAPDWVCEVSSPSTGQFDRVRKMCRSMRASGSAGSGG